MDEGQEDRSGWAETIEEVARRLGTDVQGLRAIVRELLEDPPGCAWCGFALPESEAAGTPPRTCSGRCRTALSRERKQGRASKEGAQA